MSWTERLNEALPRVRLGTAVVDIHEWAHTDEPMDGQPHRHSYFVACRVEAGEGEFTAGERHYRAGPGDLLFARPGVRHRIVGAEGFRLSWVAFEVTQASPGLDGDDASVVLQGFLAADSAMVKDSGQVGGVWDLLKEVARGPRTPGQKASLAALAPALLVALARCGGGDAQARSHRARSDGQPRPGAGGEDTSLLSGGGPAYASGANGGIQVRPGHSGGGHGAAGHEGGDGHGVAVPGSVDGHGVAAYGSGGDGHLVAVPGSGGDDGQDTAVLGGAYPVGSGYLRGHDGGASAAPEPPPDRHVRAVRMAVRYIQDNLDRPLRVEELAKQVNVSPRQLTRLFATLLNEPPASYVERVRLEHAARLLAHTETPIKQIAADLGYPDVPTFTRAFARQYQSPPGRFRRAYSVNGKRE